ncbi:MAG: DNA polymerase III subunit delta' [Syntrophus sp. (in: bacteria)]|nr:DNA polymerase III subunit delta' [Syntrophus sp. (in: bacteria)]
MAFKDIHGHEKQIRILQQALLNNRLAHAYLFYGMQGIGKKSTALVFARALNCQTGQGDACGRCPSCRKADHGNHPDLRIVEPAGQFIRIDQIRELQQQMAFRPFDGGRRTFILIDAEKMNPPAAGALLKTLEEPTQANIIILISSRPYLLPLTVLSRCQPLRFNPLTRDSVDRCLQERLGVAPPAARLLAASSGGSIGRAIEMNDADYLALRNNILEQVMGDKSVDPLVFFSMIQAFGQERKDILERLDILKGCFRDTLVYKETGMTHFLMNQDRARDIQSFADSHSAAEILKNMRAVDRAYHAIDQNANRSLTLETMMFRLAAKS